MFLLLLLLSFVSATVVSLIINVVIAQETGALEEGELDIVGNLSIVMWLLGITVVSAPGVFLNCWRRVRETGLFRFLSFVFIPLLTVGWASYYFRGRPDMHIFFVGSTVFLAAQAAAYLWFTSVVRG